MLITLRGQRVNSKCKYENAKPCSKQKMVMASKMVCMQFLMFRNYCLSTPNCNLNDVFFCA